LSVKTDLIVENSLLKLLPYFLLHYM